MATLLFTAIIATYGLCQNTLDGPARVDSVLEVPSRDPHTFGPFRNTKAFSVECQHRLRTTVPGLFFASCPTAILLFVIPVIVDSVELKQLRRTFSHVVQECLKRGTPTGTHRNATTAIARVADIARCFASSDHRSPAFVCWGLSHPVGLAAFGRDFTPKASAASFYPAREAVTIGRAFCPAVTQTVPDKQISSTTASKSSDDQSGETLAGQVTRPFVKGRSGRRIINDRSVVGVCHSGQLLN